MAHLNNDLGIGLQCIKYLLVAFNFLFALSGTLLVLTSMMVAGPLSELKPLLDSHFLYPGVFLGVVGGAVIAVSCCGIWGALKQSTALISLFSFLLSILLLLELGVGLSAFVLQDGLRNALRDRMFFGISAYNGDPMMQRAVDRMQTGLQCCGAEGPADWEEVIRNTTLPRSCCTSHPTITDCTADQILNIVPGCIPEMGIFVTRSSAFIASTAVVTAFTQFLGVLFACTLGRSIRQQKTLQEMRRVQLRNNLVNSYSPLETKPMPPITITY
ncbi:CD63 antigen-like [Thrips palmi]|uniref:Tetraspanin n=1 Tax=Thrips palmi TaxID=161013 RepID=A0A6P9A601_THRPL|nr:CD63 antigen-like [Thrips palmi]